MKVYLICPVRCADPAVLERCAAYVESLERDGHTVHYPPRDVDQGDTTGLGICDAHLRAMEAADEVHVAWDVESKGSHFDLGMAFALRKDIRRVFTVHADTPGKSYWKVMGELNVR